MASITFFGYEEGGLAATMPSGINHAAGSGLGFYGNGYGISVPVSQYQDSTYITDSLGTATSNYFKLKNTKYISDTTVSPNSSAAIPLWKMPNYYVPLNIRFTHNEAVKVQNCKLRIFDRSNIENQASGVKTQVYEVRHPNPDPTASGLSHRGASFAEHEWFTVHSMIQEDSPDIILTESPGISGTNTVSADQSNPTLGGVSFDGSTHLSTRHDWYLALSASPDGIGSKTKYGLYFTCEYL